MNRRSFVTAAAGLASVPALLKGELVLAAGASATPDSGDTHDYQGFLQRQQLAQMNPAPAVPQAAAALLLPKKARATADNIEGPYYRPGAPTRYTITQPHEPGTVLVIKGRVWGLDTRAPIPAAAVHVWQADESGHYDNDSDPSNPPAEFVNRGIIYTDATGAYEYQTIHPGRYLDGALYRPAHIHYMVFAPGYRKLTTQLYFDGDPYNATDRFIKKSLIISLQSEQRHGKTFESGVFDIVLAP